MADVLQNTLTGGRLRAILQDELGHRVVAQVIGPVLVPFGVNAVVLQELEDGAAAADLAGLPSLTEAHHHHRPAVEAVGQPHEAVDNHVGSRTRQPYGKRPARTLSPIVRTTAAGAVIMNLASMVIGSGMSHFESGRYHMSCPPFHGRCAHIARLWIGQAGWGRWVASFDGIPNWVDVGVGDPDAVGGVDGGSLTPYACLLPPRHITDAVDGTAPACTRAEPSFSCRACMDLERAPLPSANGGQFCVSAIEISFD